MDVELRALDPELSELSHCLFVSFLLFVLNAMAA
jgi:hypothetical protein